MERAGRIFDSRYFHGIGKVARSNFFKEWHVSRTYSTRPHSNHATTNTASVARQFRRGGSNSGTKPLPVELTSDSYIRVSAFHIAQTIDLPRAASIFAAIDGLERADRKNTSVFKYRQTKTNGSPTFFAIYPYGSLVFFNMAETETQTILKKVQAFTRPPLFNRQEYFGVVVTKDLDTKSMDTDHHSTVTGDYCMVPELEWNGVVVISNILAQSVALDSYADKVDELLGNFAKINSSVATTGNLTDKNTLFKTVAQNNSIFIEMISKMRILDRSDTAWNLIKYESMHYGLKDEFEIDDRFENIEFKLNLIEKNAKFFLEVIHHQKSSNLEWIIVVLILLECILMCVEMSGTGEVLFQTWSQGKLWP